MATTPDIHAEIELEIGRIGCSDINWSPTSLGLTVNLDAELVLLRGLDYPADALDALRKVPTASDADMAAATLNAYMQGLQRGYKIAKDEQDDASLPVHITGGHGLA